MFHGTSDQAMMSQPQCIMELAGSALVDLAGRFCGQGSDVTCFLPHIVVFTACTGDLSGNSNATTVLLCVKTKMNTPVYHFTACQITNVAR